MVIFGTSFPFTSSWPHLRCDVGLEEGEYRENCLSLAALTWLTNNRMIVSAMTLLVGHLTRKIVYSRYVWYTGVTTRGSFVVIFGTVGVVDTFGIDCTQRLAH